MNILDLHRYSSSTELAGCARLRAVAVPKVNCG